MTHNWNQWVWVDEFNGFVRNCLTCGTIEMKSNPCDEE